LTGARRTRRGRSRAFAAAASTRRSGGGGNRADASHQRARIISGRAFDRTHGSRRAVVSADNRGDLHGNGGMNVANVGVVIVSHSPKIAEGAADMVRQMVGDTVPLAWTGGNAEGGLGTDVAAIIAAIDRAWSEAGVVVLVDLGGAETNSEMAIELLPAGRRDKVLVCEA